MRNVLMAVVYVMMVGVVGGEEPDRYLTISARSEYRVTPDEALIEFSITTVEKKLLDAKAKNDRLTSAIVKAIKKQGVAAEDLMVTNLQIGPQNETDEESPVKRPTEYVVVRSFVVQTTNFANIDPIIGAIVENGGDEISISELRLRIRDQRKHQVEARKLAVELAREKASHLAELNGMKLGHPTSIHEGVEYNSRGGGQGVGYGGSGGGFFSTKKEREGEDDRNVVNASSPKVVSRASRVVAVSFQKEEAKEGPGNDEDILLSPGQISLNATVNIKFEILPNEVVEKKN